MKKTLNEWLTHLESAHANGLIDMGLTRVGKVAEQMQLRPTCPIVTVGGTNGKGSVCAFLTEIYHQAGFKVGTLTSPHLLKFNERIAINGKAVDDETIIESFERIEAGRGEISLTYFEVNTLAAVDIFIREQVDMMILEVGLGGRLDAVNIFDADVAVITSVDLDHQAFLGNTVEAVGHEKAGIMRAGKPVVCGQNPMPQSVIDHAHEIGADILLTKQDFSFDKLENQQWSFHFHPQNSQLFSGSRNRNALPIPALRGNYQLSNAACALTVVECLNNRLPIDIGSIKRALVLAANPGRFQVLPGRPLTILDVGHNPHAARALRQNLIALPFAQRRIAVFSILSDKDIATVVDTVKDQFDDWFIAPLDVPRGMSTDELLQALNACGIDHAVCYENIASAYQAALAQATENDRIVVFGSFHTVAAVAEII